MSNPCCNARHLTDTPSDIIHLSHPSSCIMDFVHHSFCSVFNCPGGTMNACPLILRTSVDLGHRKRRVALSLRPKTPHMPDGWQGVLEAAVCLWRTDQDLDARLGRGRGAVLNLSLLLLYHWNPKCPHPVLVLNLSNSILPSTAAPSPNLHTVLLNLFNRVESALVGISKYGIPMAIADTETTRLPLTKLRSIFTALFPSTIRGPSRSFTRGESFFQANFLIPLYLSNIQ